MPFSKWDIGACNCCTFFPCTLPTKDLTVSFKGVSARLAYKSVGVIPFIFQAGQPCSWQTGCVLDAAGGSFQFGIISAGSGEVFYGMFLWTNPACAGAFIEDSSILPSSPGGIRLVSSTCDPLNIVFLDVFSGDDITITL